jgi:hypothetical protein
MLIKAKMIQQVEEGRLVLGQFQRIIFAELDGPRLRSVRMQFMGEGVAHQARAWGAPNGSALEHEEGRR